MYYICRIYKRIYIIRVCARQWFSSVFLSFFKGVCYYYFPVMDIQMYSFSDLSVCEMLFSFDPP